MQLTARTRTHAQALATEMGPVLEHEMGTMGPVPEDADTSVPEKSVPEK